MKMSLVVPCYNEEEAIPIFYREALKVIEQLKDESLTLKNGRYA